MVRALLRLQSTFDRDYCYYHFQKLPDSFTIIIEQAVIMHLVLILRREKEMVRNEEEIRDLIVKRGCSF